MTDRTPTTEAGRLLVEDWRPIIEDGHDEQASEKAEAALAKDVRKVEDEARARLVAALERIAIKAEDIADLNPFARQTAKRARAALSREDRHE